MGELLNEINVYSIMFRMFLSLVLGGAIGIERGLRNRPAGFITYVLVCCSSSLIMITNQYLSAIYPGTDPTRLAAQVVSGIGFLGAGTIITTKKNEIKGLTTAAGLWGVAGIGIAVGSGFYAGAAIGTVFILGALVFLKHLDLYVKQHAGNMEIYIEYDNQFMLKELTGFAGSNQCVITDIEMGKIKTLEGEFGTLEFNLSFKKKASHIEVLDKLRVIPGVINIREIL